MTPNNEDLMEDLVYAYIRLHGSVDYQQLMDLGGIMAINALRSLIESGKIDTNFGGNRIYGIKEDNNAE